MLADEALAAIRGGNGAADARDRVGLARFFAETIAVQSSGLETAVTGSHELTIRLAPGR